MSTKTRVVLFDAVGTLLFPQPSVQSVYSEMGRRFGSRLPSDEVWRRFKHVFAEHEQQDHESPGSDSLTRRPTNQQREHQRWRSIVAAVFAQDVDTNSGLFQALWTHFAEAKNWSLFPEVPEVWERLRGSGMTLGIASNFDDRLQAICQATPPLDQCEHIYGSADVGFAKPCPRFFAEVSRRLGVSSEEILFVGDDAVNDYQGGLHAGWRAVLLDRSGQITEPHAIRNLTQLPI